MLFDVWHRIRTREKENMRLPFMLLVCLRFVC